MVTIPGNQRRLALLAVAALAVCALVAIPATAYAAKAPSRIVTATTKTILRDTVGVNPWPVTLTAKLQKKRSGKYRALTGTVKLYRWNPQSGESGAYVYLGSKKGSSVSFSLPGRGKYRLYYAGSTKSNTKSAAAYSNIHESIGARVSTPTVQVDEIAGTGKSWVTVTYDVSWNTEAHPDPMVLNFQAYFEGVDDGGLGTLGPWVSFEREIFAPGTVEYNYKVENAELLDVLNTWGQLYAEDFFWGRHTVTPAPVEFEWPVTL